MLAKWMKLTSKFLVYEVIISSSIVMAITEGIIKNVTGKCFSLKFVAKCFLKVPV